MSTDTIATLNYFRYEGTRPRLSLADAPESSLPTQPVRVPIRDARTLGKTLDRNGFELRRHPSALRDFTDDAQIRQRYYPECEALLRHVTGAEEVVVFDHTRRLDAERNAGCVPPVRGVHCDQTFRSGPRRVSDHLGPDEARRRLAGRHAIINVWRPLVTPVLGAPLALCDAQSIAVQDIVPADFVAGDKVGEVAMFKPSEAHRWFYYPHMTQDEVLLIKIFDSLEDGTARLSAHTAFDDPATPVGAPPRRSIELRTLVFWPT